MFQPQPLPNYHISPGCCIIHQAHILCSCAKLSVACLQFRNARCSLSVGCCWLQICTEAAGRARKQQQPVVPLSQPPAAHQERADRPVQDCIRLPPHHLKSTGPPCKWAAAFAQVPLIYTGELDQPPLSQNVRQNSAQAAATLTGQ